MIHKGDLLKVDTGAYFEGYHGDSCITVCVGEASQEAQTLSRVARESLMAGLSQVKAGNTLLDIAGAVEDHVKANGFSVVEDCTGHGVGRNLHEEPSVFNFRTDELPNVTLRPGMTLAIEPISMPARRPAAPSRTVGPLSPGTDHFRLEWEHTVLGPVMDARSSPIGAIESSAVQPSPHFAVKASARRSVDWG